MQISNFQPHTALTDAGFDALRAEGFRPIVNQRPARRVREAARLYADVLNGREDPFILQQAMNPTHELFVNYIATKYPGIYGDNFRMSGLRESMSVTDYQALTVDVIDRQYYGWYNDWPIDTLPLVKQHACMDFRLVKRYLYDGMVTPFTKFDPAAPAPLQNLYGPIPQGGTTPQNASTAAVTYQPSAYQSGASITWAATVNDDLGIFKDVPRRLAIEGNRGTAKFITGLFFDANGPNASLYSTGYKNIINPTNGASATNPPLDAQGLQDGFNVLMSMKDDTGNPIMIGNSTVYLVHGTALYATVQNLMNSLTSNISVTGGTQAGTTGFPAYQLTVNNWMKARVIPIMDPYLSIIASVHPNSWILVVDPNSLARPSSSSGS